MSYDPPEPYAHWKMHNRKGEYADTFSEDDRVTACSICDPKTKADRKEDKLRELLAKAWDEGRMAAEQDTLRHTRLNDWGDASAWNTPNPYRENLTQ